MRLPLRVLAVLVVAVAAGLAAGGAGVHGNAPAGEAGPGLLASVWGLPGDAGTFVPPPARFREGEATAQATGTQVNVRYVSFPAEAREAFAWAVQIWEGLLVSSVPIEVEARWEVMEPGLWGLAGFKHTYRNFTGAPLSDTWYPIPLANALAGKDLMPGVVDIVATFNSTTDWYFGIDGLTPPGKADFVTLVLHELAHGFGFGTTFDRKGVAGQWGGDGGMPFAYDVFVTTGAGQLLTDTAVFANPSLELGSALVGGDLFFDGAQARMANGGAPPKLYAPGTFDRLSSVLHLDEATFPAGHPDSMMTPFFNVAEAVHDPGPIALAILRDLGWTVGPPPVCYSLQVNRTGAGNVAVAPDRSPGCAAGGFVEGDAVTLSAAPVDGWLLGEWTATQGEPACPNCPVSAFVMPAAAVTVTATFIDRATLIERRLAPLVARDRP